MMGFSYSKIKMYDTCAAQYKFCHIDKLPMESGEAAERGKNIHAAIEQFLLGDETALQTETYWLAEFLTDLREKDVKPELELAITENGEGLPFDSEQYLFRGILDAVTFDGAIAHVIDWKTGKFRDYIDQLKTYSTLIFANYPEIKVVTGRIVYIDQKKIDKEYIFSRHHFDEHLYNLKDSIDMINGDEIYSPNPSYLCKYCSYRVSNGGPCRWG